MITEHDKFYHSGIVKKSIIIHARHDVVWNKISDITGLSWVLEVKKTVFLSKKKRGIGATRKITFNDGTNVKEVIVGWKNGKYLSYIAFSGLELRAYHATISIQSFSEKTVKITWQSFLNSKKMTEKQFSEFLTFMNSFYKDSLVKLKTSLEKMD
jgi:hypothetical protein